MITIELKKYAMKLSKKLKYISGGDYHELVERAKGKIYYLLSEQYFCDKYKYDLSILSNGHFIIWDWNGHSSLRFRYIIVYQLCRYYLSGRGKYKFLKDTAYPIDKDARLMAMYFLMPDKEFNEYYKLYKDNIFVLSSIFLVSKECVEYRIELIEGNNE